MDMRSISVMARGGRRMAAVAVTWQMRWAKGDGEAGGWSDRHPGAVAGNGGSSSRKQILHREDLPLQNAGGF